MIDRPAHSLISSGMAKQWALRRQAISAGARPIGWKLGFGSPSAMERLGTTAPLVGYLTDASVLDSGAVCAIHTWTRPLLEPELFVKLGRDLVPSADRVAVQAAIAGIGAAIELVDVDRAPDDIEAMLACDMFHRHVLFGPVDESRAGGSLTGISVRVLGNGQEVSRSNEPEALTGELVAIIQHVAEVVAESGEPLRAGDVIITGSLVAPLAVTVGDRIRAEFDPLGMLEVSFV